MPIKLHKFRISVVMHDGSRGTSWGLFTNYWDAIDSAMTAFYNARRITARRVA